MPTGHPDSLEPYADRLIREAMEAGEFDELKGTGKPLPGAGTTDDDLWWVRSWIQRNLSSDAHLSFDCVVSCPHGTQMHSGATRPV